MPSPFPGMDPYLEAHWGDVHTSLATYARDQLQPQLPGDLRAHVEEHLQVRLDPDENGAAGLSGKVPDVRVVEHPPGAGKPRAGSSSAVAEPLIVRYAPAPAIQRSVRIVDTRSGNRVVTAIELLSPANKVGQRGREAYRQKQEELLQGDVSLVEIDLLRAGQYVLAIPRNALPPDYQGPYRIAVVRSWRPGEGETYRISLRERLPVIRVPLRQADPDALLDLQALLQLSYANGGYDGYIDYRADPVPPLSNDDAAWADALLRAGGRR